MLIPLETIVAVVEEGGISQAAAKLHTTQPSVTRRIQQLEETYGIPLFDRQGKRVIANHAGKRVYAEAKTILKRLAIMKHEIQQFENADKGEILIGAGLTINQFLMPQLLKIFHQKYPGITFQLTSASSAIVLNKVIDYEIDIGLITTEIDHEQVHRIPLQKAEMILIAPADYPLKQKSISLAKLAQEPLIGFQKGAGFRHFIDQLWQEQGVAMHLKIETDSLEVIVKMVEQGIGLAFVPRMAALPSLQTHRIKQLMVKDLSIPQRTLSLIYRKKGYLPANAKRLIEEILTYSHSI